MKESMSLEDRVSLARYRSTIAQQRLRAAEHLLSGGFYNDAISKAYFAIHSISRALLILYGIRATTYEGVKTMLSRELILQANVLPREFAKKYSQLKSLREDADYEDFISYTEEDAKEAVDIAREFVIKGNNIISENIETIKENEG